MWTVSVTNLSSSPLIFLLSFSSPFLASTGHLLLCTFKTFLLAWPQLIPSSQWGGVTIRTSNFSHLSQSEADLACRAVWSAVILFLMPDSPVNATFMSDRERYVVSLVSASSLLNIPLTSLLQSIEVRFHLSHLERNATLTSNCRGSEITKPESKARGSTPNRR